VAKRMSAGQALISTHHFHPSSTPLGPSSPNIIVIVHDSRFALQHGEQGKETVAGLRAFSLGGGWTMMFRRAESGGAKAI
jgi:hypothetical protein